MRRLVPVACVLLFTMVAPAAGEGALLPAGSGVHGDWTVVEDGNGGCLVTQSVIGRRTGATLLQAVFAADAQDDGSVLLALRVPTGASLVDGIAYRHGAGDRVGIGLEWQSCDPERCAALARLSSGEFTRLLRGREIIVGYRPLPGSRFLNVPLSLRGLTAAWRQKQACAGE